MRLCPVATPPTPPRRAHTPHLPHHVFNSQLDPAPPVLLTLHSPRMQVHSRDSPLMSRQLVQHLATLDFPDRDCPISAAHSYSRAVIVPRPSHADEGGLETRRSTREGSVDPHRVGREGTDIVDDESGVERVGREEVA
jgi:hypothetical protein